MFERYTDPAKRAVYFAHARAICADASQIDSVDVLAGLLFEDGSRAETLFRLREYFPMYRLCPCKYAKLPEIYVPLDEHRKRIIRHAAIEANLLQDFWIDAEHLVLGILRVPKSTAASYLSRTGLTLKAARQLVKNSMSSRPDYGKAPRLWRFQSPFLRFKARATVF